MQLSLISLSDDNIQIYKNIKNKMSDGFAGRCWRLMVNYCEGNDDWRDGLLCFWLTGGGGGGGGGVG